MACYFDSSGTNTATWKIWTTTSVSSYADDSTWVLWNSPSVDDTSVTLSSTASTAAVWLSWTNQAGWVESKDLTYDGVPWEDQRSPEELARYEAQLAAETAEIRRKADLAVQERRAAIAKAEALLDSMLTVKQREQLQRERFFEVVGSHSGKRYRIRQGTHGNVRLLEGKRESIQYCAQPGGVPMADSMLSQKLMLETDEQEFLRVANPSPVR